MKKLRFITVILLFSIGQPHANTLSLNSNSNHYKDINCNIWNSMMADRFPGHVFVDSIITSTRVIPVPHISLTVQSSFELFTSRLETLLGRFDPAVVKKYARDKVKLKKGLLAMQGAYDLMLFTVDNHGGLLVLYGKKVKAKQYAIGNPLIASSMTVHDIRAALYAPLHVLIYEDNEHKTHVEYDLPSSQFGQFKNPDVTAVGNSLDIKLLQLIRAADRKHN